ncbi:MAG: hypothetical protein J6S60_02915 [Oscillospiraceae bacterium]|nr:hypothetical protein [Oscillospiraceae bacterium]
MSELGKQLLEAVESDFTAGLNSDKKIAWLQKRIEKGGKWRDAEEYAARLGELRSGALQRNITAAMLPEGRMSRELAEEILTPALTENYRLALEAAAQVQEGLNEAAGIGMKAVRPGLNTDRIQGLTERIGNAESFDDVSWLLGEPVVNFTQSVADETLEANVDAHAGAGLSPKIIRIAEGDCCKWCQSLEGEYDYPPPHDVYRRHENCRCQVIYTPSKRIYQDVHSKRQFESERDARVEHSREIQARAEREAFAQSIVRAPERLADYTPGSLKSELESRGFSVKPLSRGAHRGRTFEDGGGWKVNFGNDGLIQYHPEDRSHHQGEYYKISNSQRGIIHYTTKGEEIDVRASQAAGRQIIKHL